MKKCRLFVLLTLIFTMLFTLPVMAEKKDPDGWYFSYKEGTPSWWYSRKDLDKKLISNHKKYVKQWQQSKKDIKSLKKILQTKTDKLDVVTWEMKAAVDEVNSKQSSYNNKKKAEEKALKKLNELKEKKASTEKIVAQQKKYDTAKEKTKKAKSALSKAKKEKNSVSKRYSAAQKAYKNAKKKYDNKVKFRKNTAKKLDNLEKKVAAEIERLHEEWLKKHPFVPGANPDPAYTINPKDWPNGTPYMEIRYISGTETIAREYFLIETGRMAMLNTKAGCKVEKNYAEYLVFFDKNYKKILTTNEAMKYYKVWDNYRPGKVVKVYVMKGGAIWYSDMMKKAGKNLDDGGKKDSSLESDTSTASEVKNDEITTFESETDDVTLLPETDEISEDADESTIDNDLSEKDKTEEESDIILDKAPPLEEEILSL